jgi:dUTP pyrophosphatase
MKIEIEVMEDGLMPVKGSEGASCYDIFARDIYFSKDDNAIIVMTGIKTKFSSDYSLEVKPRSNLSTKGWAILNSPGTIDSDYRGEIQVRFTPIPVIKYTSNGSVHSITNRAFPYKKGDRIAQIAIKKVEKIEWELTTITEDTDRGSGGFGSTGLSKEVVKNEKIKKENKSNKNNKSTESTKSAKNVKAEKVK